MQLECWFVASALPDRERRLQIVVRKSAKCQPGFAMGEVFNVGQLGREEISQRVIVLHCRDCDQIEVATD